MKELVFLLEEESAKALLEALLPRLLAPGMRYRLIPFEGKQDLEKQLIRKFRAPDALGNPSQELKTLTRNRYQKVSGSRQIGRFLSLDNPGSPSFHHLVTAIRRWETELAG